MGCQRGRVLDCGAERAGVGLAVSYVPVDLDSGRWWTRRFWRLCGHCWRKIGFEDLVEGWGGWDGAFADVEGASRRRSVGRARWWVRVLMRFGYTGLMSGAMGS